MPTLLPKQGCHGQGKISGKRNFFQVREKSGNFVDGQEILEGLGKSGNLKMAGSLQKIYLHVFCSRAERMYMYFEIVESHLPPHGLGGGGRKNLLFPLRVTPNLK